MSEIKCPKCGAIFTVDEADYAAILNQVKNDAFDAEISQRLAELHKQQEAEQATVILKTEQGYKISCRPRIQSLPVKIQK